MSEVPVEDQLSRDLQYVIMRQKRLLIRRTMLLKFQEFLEKNILTKGGFEKKDEEEGPSELELVEKELQSLAEKERELMNRKCLWEKQAIIQEKPPEPSATDVEYITLGKKTDLISGVCVLPNDINAKSLITEQPASFDLEQTSEHSPGITVSPGETVDIQNLSLSAAKVQCPTCLQQVTTEIHYKVGRSTFFLCFLSIALGCVAGCCLLPFFVNYFKDVSHKCPSCHKEIQTVSRL